MRTLTLKDLRAQVAVMYWAIIADLEKRNPLRLNLDGDPGMNVGHWIYIIIGFAVLFVVLVALYPTLSDKTYKFGNQTGAIGAIFVVWLPVLLGLAVRRPFGTNFRPGVSRH